MTTDPTTAREMLDRADSLGREGRRQGRYLVPYFRAWALGSAVLGAALFFAPLVDSPWYFLGCFVPWLVFVGLLAVYAMRHQRRHKPRGGPALVLGVLGGSLPWSFSAVLQGPLQRHHATWWLAGLPFLAAGLVCAACLLGAAELARRQSR